MNRKGFTLIELLATIVILGIVGGIATYGVINTINTSKLKSEKIFVDKLSNLIDDYLDLYSSELIKDKSSYPVTFKKCKIDNCVEYYDNNSYEVTANKILKKYNATITIRVLVKKDIVTYKDLVNPKNNLECFDNSTNNPQIVVYKDTDFVYHYYVDLSKNKCAISNENVLINNMPNNIIKVLNDNGVTLPQILKDTLSKQ